MEYSFNKSYNFVLVKHLDCMRKLKISLTMGIVVGFIDVIPMIIQGLNWYANISAFAMWIFLGVIINYVNFKLASWFKGFLVAEMVAVPVIVIVSQNGFRGVVPIILTTAILGSLVGYFGEKLAYDRTEE
jgi:hypothetical protein